MSTATKVTLHFTVVAAIILVAAFSRRIPHMLNFSPLGAIALFCAAHFQKKWQAFLIPITATWLSDSGVLFGTFALAQMQFPALRPAKA